ncbi:MAG: PaaI family thioesterase [SAR324 cluster bacterium]|nr:PaaI family thioesterase [SAR324 cluster bacterium]
MTENKIPEGYKRAAWTGRAEEMVGPFFYRKKENGRIETAFVAEARHCNGLKVVHGGILMTFGDYSITMQALSGVSESCTTISFNCEFAAPGHQGDLIEANAEVLRRTGSLVFLRGKIFADEQILLNYSAIVKRLRLEK